MKRFVGTRTRGERLADAQQFFGWVSSSRTDEIGLTPTGGVLLQAGDDVMLILDSAKGTARFLAKVRGLIGTEVRIQLPPRVRIDPPTQVRVKTTDVKGTILVEDRAIAVEGRDASSSGIGLASPEPIEPGTSVHLRLETPHGPVDSEAEVLYCQVAGEDTKGYRIGLRLGALDRIESSRWQRLLNAA